MARIFMPWKSPLLSVDRLKDTFVIKAMDKLMSALLMSTTWQSTMRTIQEILEAVPVVSGSVGLVAQGSAIATTDVPTPPLTAGLCRVTYYLRTVVPGSISSAFRLTVGWVDGGVAQTVQSANVNGNTTTSLDQGSFLVHVDQGTKVNYAVSYASNAPGAQYDLYLDLEMLP